MTAIKDETRSSVSVTNNFYGPVGVGSVSGGVLQGNTIAGMAQAAQDETAVQAALEAWAAQWEEQEQADREAMAQAIAEAIPQEKHAFWSATLANFLGGGTGGAAAMAAAELLKTYLGG